ncbi:MAG: glycosyltransferase family 4 protein [Thermotogota bacterium]|nr:glycosyltransferase family 4 protein [Thermotogota bacterium]
MKVLIFADSFSLPIDEGRKKVTYYFIKAFSRNDDVLTFCNRGEEIPNYVKKINTNRMLISLRLKKEISTFKPDLIIYIPPSSASIYSFIRAKILKKYAKNAKVVMIAHTPINYKKHHLLMIRMFRSFFPLNTILTPSPQLYDKLKKYQFNVKLFTYGVDIEKFKPVNLKTKLELRNRYGLKEDTFVVLHVGHITKSRNIDVFNEIQKIEGVQCLIVCSESVTKDKELFKKLKESGVILIPNYIDPIEEIYQLSDCYVFQGGAISMPLSVLEAMSCNIPVVTTRFEILPTLFNEGYGLFYCTSKNEVINKVMQIKSLCNIGTRALVEQYSWENLVERIKNIVKN